MSQRRVGLADQQPPGLSEGGVAGAIAEANADEPKPKSPEEIAELRRKTAETARTGSRTAPYERKRDKIKTVKLSFVCTKKVADRLNLYTLKLADGWTRASFIEAAIARAIEDNIDKK